MKRLEAKIETEIPCSYINAVRPDDVDIPQGMEISHICVNGAWHIYVLYIIKKPEDILTLKNTLDEIVRSLRIIEAILQRPFR